MRNARNAPQLLKRLNWEAVPLFSAPNAKDKTEYFKVVTLPDNEISWYRLPLTPEQIEFGFVNIIRAEIEEIWISTGALEGFTVWLKEGDDLTEIYFSPVAAEAAKLLLFRFNGTPCTMPQLESLSFLLGSAFFDERPTNDGRS